MAVCEVNAKRIAKLAAAGFEPCSCGSAFCPGFRPIRGTAGALEDSRLTHARQLATERARYRDALEQIAAVGEFYHLACDGDRHAEECPGRIAEAALGLPAVEGKA